MDEETKIRTYRKELEQRLDACSRRPQDELEYWINEDDVSFLKSINVLLT